MISIFCHRFIVSSSSPTATFSCELSGADVGDTHDSLCIGVCVGAFVGESIPKSIMFSWCICGIFGW